VKGFAWVRFAGLLGELLRERGADVIKEALGGQLTKGAMADPKERA